MTKKSKIRSRIGIISCNHLASWWWIWRAKLAKIIFSRILKKFPDFLLWEIWIENSSQHGVASSQHHAWCQLAVYISIASIYSAQLSTGGRSMSALKKKFPSIIPEELNHLRILTIIYLGAKTFGRWFFNCHVTHTPVRAVRVQAYVRIGSRTIRSIRLIAMIPAVFICKLTTLFP